MLDKQKSIMVNLKSSLKAEGKKRQNFKTFQK